MKPLTEILIKIDWLVLNEYIEKGLIISNKHPKYDIWILNYSAKTTFDKLWDLYTISCRGLIIDIDGNILARPFTKFWNYEEHDPSDIDMSMDYEVFNKMDGSLGILFYYEKANLWIISSRGSFASEQAIEAEKILNEKNIVNKLTKDRTFLVEIIFESNRIVCNYLNMRDLVLLAEIHTASGYEIPYNAMKDNYSNLFTIVEKYEIPKVNNLLELKQLETENKEGFVIRFTNGFRCKIKFSEYIRLHKILTNVSTKTVWEHISNGLSIDELAVDVPDEFYSWLKKTVKDLEIQYLTIEKQALEEFVHIYHNNNITEKRWFAEEAKKSKLRAILFKIYDKKTYNDIIFKVIKPEFQKPFKDGYQNEDL